MEAYLCSEVGLVDEPETAFESVFITLIYHSLNSVFITQCVVIAVIEV